MDCIICGKPTAAKTTRTCSKQCRKIARETGLMGNGYAGRNHSQATKDRMVESHAVSPKKQNIIDANKGRIITEKTRSLMSIAQKEIGQRPEVKAIRKRNADGENNSRYGATLTPEHKKILSKTHKGKIITPEHRQATSIRMTGKNHPLYGTKLSDEQKAKSSKSHKEYWANLTPEQKIERTKLTMANGAKGGRCKWYVLAGVKAQGTYEFAYLYQLQQLGHLLPVRPSKWVETPVGLYAPDFEFEDHYVEVKSTYTFKNAVARGQLKKLNWTTKNVKPVRIALLTQKQVTKILLNVDLDSYLIPPKKKRKKRPYQTSAPNTLT